VSPLTNMKTAEKTELYDHAKMIAENITNGIEVQADEFDHIEYGYQPGDILNGLHYLEDALDFRYLVDSSGDLLQVQILVAFGGPNIWVHLWRDGSGEVCAFWWGDHATAPIYADAMGIFEACEQIWECK